MKHRNCPNCAAPYDIDEQKCPYCGTSYFDMSCVDFTNGEPFYLKFKINNGGQDYYITQLVIANVGCIEMSTESVDIYDGRGHSVLTMPSRKTCTTSVSFEAVCDPKTNSLFTIN